MRKFLLLLIFIILGTTAYSQSSERLSYKKSKTDKVTLRVFPNPVTTFIGISDNDAVKNVRVFNLVGRQMKAFTFVKGKKYYVGDLPKGMYLVQLLDNDNQILTTQRVSKR